MSSEKLEMTVKMQVTEAQALALKAMFEYWTGCGGVGASRKVGFYLEGDGDFQPKCETSFSREIHELTPEMSKSAVIVDQNGDRLYDYDPIGWMLDE